jgi:hypothetical protein
METTVLAKLVMQEEDTMGYITYVFECLDPEVSAFTKYIMCTRFPNWQHGVIETDVEGFLHFREVVAGKDTWYDGSRMIPYQFSNIHFIKFIPKIEKEHRDFIL